MEDVSKQFAYLKVNSKSCHECCYSSITHQSRVESTGGGDLTHAISIIYREVQMRGSTVFI